MIEEAIIKPIEDYMAGNGELHRFPIVQSARDCCRTGLQTELHNLMEPYYNMYLDDSARLDWTTRGIIAEIAHIDTHFGSWASRQDLMKMALSRLAIGEFSLYRICIMSLCPENFCWLNF